MLLPNAEVVATEWLAQRLDMRGLVATTLPEPTKDGEAVWPDGFVQVASIPGLASVDQPYRRETLLQVDVWGNSVRPGQSSRKPPWGATGDLVMRALDAFDDGQDFGATMVWPERAPWMPVRVLSAYAVAEPDKVEGDPSGYARFTFDAVFVWTIVRPLPRRADHGTNQEGAAP